MGYILAVDDEPDFRSLLKLMLRGVGGGREVRIVAGGQEALDHLEKELPDLILLDMMMPGLDGKGFLQVIQDNPPARAIPVILLSALDRSYFDLPTIENPLQHFQKGRFTPAMLRETIDRLLNV